jgi:hypothetical protein
MTQSIPSEHNSEKESVSTTTEQKRFLDLSSIEIEQLVLKATTQAKKRMHDKGISTIFSVGDKVYEEHPDRTITLRHG